MPFAALRNRFVGKISRQPEQPKIWILLKLQKSSGTHGKQSTTQFRFSSNTTSEGADVGLLVCFCVTTVIGLFVVVNGVKVVIL